MKDEQRVYIKGNAERGNEIIKLLEDLGGNNTFSYEGNNKDAYYFINPKGEINWTYDSGGVFPYIKEFYKEIDLPKWKSKCMDNYFYINIMGENYFYINTMGEVMADIWDDTDADKFRYNFGNCFKTFEEAKLARDKIKEILNKHK